MKKIILAAALSGVFFSAVQAATVHTESKVSLSNMSIQIIDLLPSDSITPSLIFSPGAEAQTYGRETDTFPGGKSASDSLYGWQAPRNIGASTSVPNSDAQSSVTAGSGTYRLTDAVATGMGGSNLETSAITHNYSTFYSSVASLSGGLYLSAHTQIIVTVDADMYASTIVPVDGRLSVGSNAYARLTIGDLRTETFVDSGTGFSGGPTQTESEHKVQTLTLTFSNDSDKTIWTLLSAYSLANGSINVAYSSVPPPVPEPETYAMLLAGLALVGAAAHWRQKRA